MAFYPLQGSASYIFYFVEVKGPVLSYFSLVEGSLRRVSCETKSVNKFAHYFQAKEAWNEDARYFSLSNSDRH